MLTVLVADEQRIVRQGTRALFEREGRFRVVGEAGDGQSAVRLACALVPHVVLMDVDIGGMRATEATRRIRSARETIQVIAFCSRADERSMREMFEAGASGYLTKDCDVTRLCTAVSEVAQGRVCIDVYRPRAQAARPVREDVGRDLPLTEREVEVVQLIGIGLSTKEIASVLHLSVKTIESHRSRICRKLAITNVAGITRYAIVTGLISVDD